MIGDGGDALVKGRLYFQKGPYQPSKEITNYC
jgi:hypothetical protein